MKFYEGFDLYQKINDYFEWLGVVRPDCAEQIWSNGYWSWADEPGEPEAKHITFSDLCEYASDYIGAESLIDYMMEKKIMSRGDLAEIADYAQLKIMWNPGKSYEKIYEESVFDYFFND